MPTTQSLVRSKHSFWCAAFGIFGSTFSVYVTETASRSRNQSSGNRLFVLPLSSISTLQNNKSTARKKLACIEKNVNTWAKKMRVCCKDRLRPPIVSPDVLPEFVHRYVPSTGVSKQTPALGGAVLFNGDTATMSSLRCVQLDKWWSRCRPFTASWQIYIQARRFGGD